MTTDMLYQFPRIRYVAENGICAQVAHIQTEADEAFRELTASPDIDALAMEVMDVYHSAETALRILEEKHGVDVQALMHRCYEKNEERGYYQ